MRGCQLEKLCFGLVYSWSSCSGEWLCWYYLNHLCGFSIRSFAWCAYYSLRSCACAVIQSDLGDLVASSLRLNAEGVLNLKKVARTKSLFALWLSLVVFLSESASSSIWLLRIAFSKGTLGDALEWSSDFLVIWNFLKSLTLTFSHPHAVWIQFGIDVRDRLQPTPNMFSF